MRLLESRNNNTWNSEKEGGNKRRTKQKVEMTGRLRKAIKRHRLLVRKRVLDNYGKGNNKGCINENGNKRVARSRKPG